MNIRNTDIVMHKAAIRLLFRMSHLEKIHDIPLEFSGTTTELSNYSLIYRNHNYPTADSGIRHDRIGGLRARGESV